MVRTQITGEWYLCPEHHTAIFTGRLPQPTNIFPRLHHHSLLVQDSYRYLRGSVWRLRQFPANTGIGQSDVSIHQIRRRHNIYLLQLFSVALSLPKRLQSFFEFFSCPGRMFSYCGRARAYTHVLARVYSTRASTCTIYTCFTLPPTRVNPTGLQLSIFQNFAGKVYSNFPNI